MSERSEALRAIFDTLPKIQLPEGADEGTKVVALAKSTLAGGYSMSIFKESPGGKPVVMVYAGWDDYPGDTFIYDAFEDDALISLWIGPLQLHLGKQYPSDIELLGSKLQDEIRPS